MHVAISISESGDLSSRGLSEMHLLDGMNELARCLLLRNHGLAYGGDLRPGFTDALEELARVYGMDSTAGQIVDYVPWPAAYFKKKEWQRYRQSLKLVPVLPPDDVRIDRLVPDSPAYRYACARTNTRMREMMTKETGARFVLGGRTEGYAGLWPGIVEECYVTLKNGKPLYLIGAFGGAAQVVIEALRGNAAHELTQEHWARQPNYAALSEEYQRSGPVEDPTRDLHAFFATCGMSGLNNGLTRSENEVLFATDEIPVIVALVLKGLSRVEAGGA